VGSSDRTLAAPELPAAVEAVGSVVRLMCHLRLAVLALGVVTAVAAGDLTGAALLVTVLAVPFSYVPARTWDRRGEQLSRSGILLACDLAITAIVIAVMPGLEPVVIYACATAALFGATVGLQLAIVMGAPIALLVLVAVNAVPRPPHAAVGIAAAASVIALAWAGSRIGDGLRQQAETARVLRLAQAGQAATLERVRIARDLHDTVAGDLAGIVLLTQAVRRRLGEADVSPTLLALAAQLESSCVQAHQATRVALGELRRATELPRQMVETTCRQWSERAGLPVDLDVTADLERMSASMADDLRSILLEALENVRKHAHATQVRVAISRSGDGVRLVVADDGCGIERADVLERADVRDLEQHERHGETAHFGLQGMRERAAMHGGDLSLAGAPGRGTSLSVQLNHDTAVAP